MRTIKVNLTFSENDINTILESQYFGDGVPPTVSDLSEEQFQWLTEEMQRSADNFVYEIVESSANAEDWLTDLTEDLVFAVSECV